MKTNKELLEESARWSGLLTQITSVREEYKMTCNLLYGDEGEARFEEQFSELFENILDLTHINERYARHTALYGKQWVDNMSYQTKTNSSTN